MKILFVSHEASRTGAPLLLLNFLKWLKRNHSSITFEILLMRGGALLEDFKAVATTHILTKPIPVSSGLLSRVKRKFVKEDQQNTLFEFLGKAEFSIIYANTVASCKIAIEIRNRTQVKPKVILHVHELQAIINQVNPELHLLVPHVSLVIAASEAVKRNLVENHRISDSCVRKVNEFIMLGELQSAVTHSHTISDSLIPEGKFVVGGSGNVHWRKGTDLYIQVAREVFKREPEFNGIFVWVGLVPDHERPIHDEDVRKTGLSGKVLFTGPLNPPYACFGKFSLLLMTSREDPFPVVSLELGALGKPIICFRDAGGTEEMIDSGGGEIVPYLDIGAMASEVIAYYRNPEKRIKDGKRNESLFIKYDIEEIAPQLLSVIHECRS